MRIVVCIRQGRNGEINPFDACAYEEALKIEGAEITLLSMGIPSTESFLLNLTRLGAKSAILLTDKAFAEADTLATAYTLSLAIKKLDPDLVFCGRQTLEGETAQTAPMLAEKIGFNLITNAMEIKCRQTQITCKTRNEGEISVCFPAIITVERINNLRLPSLRSKTGTVTVLTAKDLNADLSKCGLAGSPTRILEIHENNSGRRKCVFIETSMLNWAIKQGLSKQKTAVLPKISPFKTLPKVYTVGNDPRLFAETISDDITVIPFCDKHELAGIIKKDRPNAVLWGSDSVSKRLSSQVASILDLGLCADCTGLETDGETLFMIRPALSGSVIAKIKSLSKPAMATVRTTTNDTKDIILCLGFGAKDSISGLKAFAESIGADIAATRKAVDNNLMPYAYQVGLTGKMTSPLVYIAAGVSGAIHHIVGMEKSGTVIAINSDKNAPIFDYADFGIVSDLDFISG